MSVAGLLVKLGVPPFYLWVVSATMGCSSIRVLFVLLGPLKWGPLMALSRVLSPVTGECDLLLLRLAFVGGLGGAVLGLSQGAWQIKLSLAGLGSTGWATVGCGLCWWVGPAFYFLYTLALLLMLWLTARQSANMPLVMGGSGLISFLVFAGMPPGWVFLAKWGVITLLCARPSRPDGAFVLGTSANLVVPTLTVLTLALAEFISWVVYVRILLESWLRTG